MIWVGRASSLPPRQCVLDEGREQCAPEPTAVVDHYLRGLGLNLDLGVVEFVLADHAAKPGRGAQAARAESADS